MNALRFPRLKQVSSRLLVLLFIGFVTSLLLLSLNQNQDLTQDSDPITLYVKNREIVVNGKPSQVFEIVQSNGKPGLTLYKDDLFNVIVENQIKSPTGIHWHGLLLPNNQDGVPDITQPPIMPNERYPYNFPLIQSGTFWMHAHYGLQEQKLLAAPLIIRDVKDKQLDQQEIIMFLSDFTFQDPHEVFDELRHNGSKHTNHMAHNHKMSMPMDLNDVQYDAYLTNWKTLSDPDVILVKPGKIVRLRVINGSSSSNFFINLGSLRGKAIAVDGNNIIPLENFHFEIGTAQRIDILIKIPSEPHTYPIIAQGEGSTLQTGLVLVNQESLPLPKLSERASQPSGALTYTQEALFNAKTSLIKRDVDRKLVLTLDGDMVKYVWTLNGKAWPDNEPLMVKEGERVELTFINQSSMSHPMHLHGHVFQVTEINGKTVEGALRDTILVLPHSTVKVQFDADYPGRWPLHCHNLYHQYAGMFTTLDYEEFKAPDFPKTDEI